MREDHPRSRGVYAEPAYNFPYTGWIIPARAGFTATGQEEIVGRAGSSPLARGLRYEVDGRRYLTGIIPARAGFTPCAASTGTCPLDHPRSRGVYAA